MNATKRLTPKRRRHPLLRLSHNLGPTSLNALVRRAGAVWIMTDVNDQFIVRARSDRGEEWVARGR